MVEKSNKRRKGAISEDDVSTLLQRYDATTVLALLQEVAQVSDFAKIDWNELVRKTATGISNAREYQMLWRHLAYRDTLAEKLDDGTETLDDDSDLDYELEAFPPVGSEASTEAAACVKVLIASGLQSLTSLPNWSTVEAPLTINIPNGQSSRDPSEYSQMLGTNITIPVSVQKQPLSSMACAEGLDANGSANGNLPNRRKRKIWTEAEDLLLIASVQKRGEGNWAGIVKEEFKGARTASQLSQRWNILRKRPGNLTVGGVSNPVQLSEAQLAARRAVSMALNMPMRNNLITATSSNAGTNPNATPSNSTRPAAVEASSVALQAQRQLQQDFAPTTTLKSRVLSKKPLTKPALSPDDLVKATAVAAGARIATPSDAATLLKAAQAMNAVHIMPGGGSLIKSSVAGSASALPPNVHFIRTGLANAYAAPANASRPGGTQLAQNNSPKPAARAVQLNVTGTTKESNFHAEVTNSVASCTASDLKADNIISSSSSNPPKEHVQEDKELSVSGNAPGGKVQQAQTAVLGDASEDKVQENQDSVSGNVPEEHKHDQAAQEDQTALPRSQNNIIENSNCSTTSKITGKEATAGSENKDENKMISISVEDGRDNQSALQETCESQSLDGKQGDFPSTVRDASDESSGVLVEAAAGAEKEEGK